MSSSRKDSFLTNDEKYWAGVSDPPQHPKRKHEDGANGFEYKSNGKTQYPERQQDQPEQRE